MAAKKETELTKLRRETSAYLDKWAGSGGKLTRYKCRSCGRKENVRQPEPSMVGARGYWDLMMRCTRCGDLNFVKVYPSGRTVVAKVGT